MYSYTGMGLCILPPVISDVSALEKDQFMTSMNTITNYTKCFRTSFIVHIGTWQLF